MRVRISKVINAIRLIIQSLYLYSIFYLTVVLFTNVDILVKLIAVAVIALLLILNSNIGNVIDFIASTNQIFLLSSASVLVGFFVTNWFMKMFDYIILNSKYLINVETTITSTAIILIFLIIFWFFISYYFFKISIRYIEKLEIKKIRIIVLTKHHFKVLEAGTVFAGFMSLLVSIIIKPEINNVINNFVLFFYLLCLIPFLYFHFNEEEYKRKDQE